MHKHKKNKNEKKTIDAKGKWISFSLVFTSIAKCVNRGQFS